MPTEAKENLFLDALLVVAQAVVGGATYNTNPAVKQIDVPLDALPEGPGEAIYVVWIRSDSTDELLGAGGPFHRYSVYYNFCCVGDTNREALNVADDVRRSFHTSESTLLAIARYGVYDSMLTPHPDLLKLIGRPTVIVQVRADMELSH